MPRHSPNPSRRRSHNIFSWLRSRRHTHENGQSTTRGELIRSYENDRVDIEGGAPKRSAPRERYPPPSYDSTVNTVQASASPSEDSMMSSTTNTEPPIPTTSPPRETEPPAFDDEPPPPSYEDATEDSPRHIRLVDSSNSFTIISPGVTVSMMGTNGMSVTSANGAISMTGVDPSGGVHVTRRSGADGSTVHNITISGRNYGGIQVGAISGASLTMSNGTITYQSRRTDSRGNIFTHTFSGTAGGGGVRIGNISVTGGRNGAIARNITISNSGRRPSSPSRYRSAGSNDRSETDSSGSESDEDGGSTVQILGAGM